MIWRHDFRLKPIFATALAALKNTTVQYYTYWFGQAKFAYGGLVLGSSKFSLLPQLPKKTKLNSNRLENNHLASLV